MKTLVLGLGNQILSDDSVGLKIVAGLQEMYENPAVDIISTEFGGINLMEMLAGYDRALIIDSIVTRGGKPGRIYEITPGVLQGVRHADSAHGIDFASVIELGKKIGLKMPEEIIIYAVEASDVNTFGEQCTPEVEKAISKCVTSVLAKLEEHDENRLKDVSASADFS